MLKHAEASTDPVSEASGGGFPRSALAADALGANVDKNCWERVQRRLQVEVGEAIFSSWFASMEFERVDGNGVRLSVPTRFL